MSNNKAFTLIEVLISAIIIGITVFGVLRLANNNSSQVSIIEKNKDIYTLFNNSKECLKSFPFAYLQNLSSTASLNFGSGNNICQTGSYNTNYSFSGVTLKNYYAGAAVAPDEYYIYFISSGSTADKVDIKTYITNRNLSKEFLFTIYK